MIPIYFLAILMIALSSASAAPGQAPNGTAPALVEWTDPTEHAFTVKVPQGWKINGGTKWQGPITPRGYVIAESPDGKIRAFLDDPDVIGRQVPHPMYAPLGWREGMRVQTPSGDPLLIARFETGEQFAKHYIGSKLCQQPEITGNGPLQDETDRITKEIAPFARSMNAMFKASAGEATFRCSGKEGYTYATTILAGPPSSQGVQGWFVFKLAGYTVTEAAQHDLARYVMYSMLSSVTLDKEWEAKTNRKVQDVTGNVIKMQNAMTQAALRRAKEQAANSLARLNHPNEGVKGLGRNKDSDDRLSTQRSNTTLGTKRVCDDLGDCKSVDNSHDYYWKDHSGRVVPGPSSGGPPDNSGVWRPMQ
jgi:hypothetical protein